MRGVHSVHSVHNVPPGAWGEVTPVHPHGLLCAQGLRWGESAQSLVLSSFLWGFCASPLLGGRLAQAFGAKAVLGVSLLLSSLASLLLPAAATLGGWQAACGVRVAQGLFQASAPARRARRARPWAASVVVQCGASRRVVSRRRAARPGPANLPSQRPDSDSAGRGRQCQQPRGRAIARDASLLQSPIFSRTHATHGK